MHWDCNKKKKKNNLTNQQVDWTIKTQVQGFWSTNYNKLFALIYRISIHRTKQPYAVCTIRWIFGLVMHDYAVLPTLMNMSLSTWCRATCRPGLSWGRCLLSTPARAYTKHDYWGTRLQKDWLKTLVKVFEWSLKSFSGTFSMTIVIRAA